MENKYVYKVEVPVILRVCYTKVSWYGNDSQQNKLNTSTKMIIQIIKTTPITVPNLHWKLY